MKNLSIPNNINNKFTVTDTNIIKGVAIILLLFHHCFLQSSVDMAGGDVSFFPFSQQLGVIICTSFKLCVGVFAFLSGYGMLCSLKKTKLNIKGILGWVSTRLVKMMSGFYFIYIIVFAVTLLIDKYPIVRYYTNTTPLKGTLAMIIDFLGLAKLFDTRTLIGTWWYMTAAIMFVLVCPFLYLISKKLKYTTLIIAVVAVPRLTIGYPGAKSWISFLLALIFGMLFADYDLFAKLDNIKLCKNEKLSNGIMLAIMLCLLIAIPWVNNYVKWSAVWEWDFAIAPVIVIVFVKKYLAPIKGVRNALHYLGVYSMDIYLIHTFFRYVYLKSFIYSFKYALLIWIVLMAISLAASIALEALKKAVKYDKLVDEVVKKIKVIL